MRGAYIHLLEVQRVEVIVFRVLAHGGASTRSSGATATLHGVGIREASGARTGAKELSKAVCSAEGKGAGRSGIAARRPHTAP